ncbi:hypothetical protein SAMN05216231_0197 [Virgibacillus salinus]|uniref:Uncharacterized protein n=1 Tax=Virgibacillus salinus TaxID=553311 RepID=A0A1H0XUE9_9BACI|nr:hypothetical protein SAMN05216231_0197 [Virgibacillus salinus]
MGIKNALVGGLVGLFVGTVLSRISLLLIISNFHILYIETHPNIYSIIVKLVFIILGVIMSSKMV